MNYSEFKMYLLNSITNLTGCEAQVSIRKIRKNNGIFLDGLTIHYADRNIAPTIYLDSYWQKYLDGRDADAIVGEILADNETYSIERNLDVHEFLDFSRLRDRVMYRLINYEMNRDFLDTVPMREVLDLAVVYYYRVEDEELSGATCVIRNEDVERWGVTEEELWDLASVNTPRDEPAKIRGICDSLREYYIVNGKDDPESLSEMEDVLCMAGMAPMHILSNRSQVFGAACILYPDTMKKLSKEFKRDLYVLPSSIHEVILMPAEELYDPDDLSVMVREINETEVLPQEVLSDHVYRYFADRGVITL